MLNLIFLGNVFCNIRTERWLFGIDFRRKSFWRDPQYLICRTIYIKQQIKCKTPPHRFHSGEIIDAPCPLRHTDIYAHHSLHPSDVSLQDSVPFIPFAWAGSGLSPMNEAIIASLSAASTGAVEAGIPLTWASTNKPHGTDPSPFYFSPHLGLAEVGSI